MTVAEALAQYNGQDIKLGSRSGYVFCGTVDDSTLDKLDDLSREYFSRLTDQLLRKVEAISKMNVNTEIENKELLARQIEHYTKKIRAFTSYRDREVKTTYPSIIGDGTIIIMKGEEAGRFYTAREWRMKEGKDEREVLLAEAEERLF